MLLAALSTLNVYSQELERPYNRFQYHKYTWQTFHTEAFHIYFPKGYDSLCAFVARELPGTMELIKKRMITSLQKEPNVIIYPSPDQLYESNIGGFELRQYTLPTVVLKGSRMLIAYTGSYEQLGEDLREALVRSVWEEQFKTNLETQLKGITMEEEIPAWFSEGIISYFSHGWTIADEDALRNFLGRNNPDDWQMVIAYRPRLAGAALCHYLTRQYYRQAVVQLFFQLKKKRSLPRAARLITKTPLDSLYHDCLSFYKNRFSQAKENAQPKPTAQVMLKYGKGMLKDLQISPDNTHIVYTVSRSGKRTVYIADLKTGSSKKVVCYQLPPWLWYHTSDTYPLTTWNRDGRQLYVGIPRKGKLRISSYDLSGNKLQENILFGVDGVGSMKHYQGHELLLSAFRKGQSDIVSYDLRREKYLAHTDDSYDDTEPDADEAGAIVFSSTRDIVREDNANTKDSLLRVQGIFKAGMRQPVVSDTLSYVRWNTPVMLNDQILARTTQTGTQKFALIDASGTQALLGNYKPYSLSEKNRTITFWDTHNDSIRISQYNTQEWITYQQAQLSNNASPWLKDYLADAQERAKEDSILKAARYSGPSFLEGVLTPKNSKEKAQHRKDSILQSLLYDPAKVSPYILQLHSAYFNASVNNDYFINRYQPYVNYQGQFKFPGPGGMVQGGFTDLFENHHFSISYRMPAGTEGSDFFVRYENTARKTDWSLLWFRKVESLQADPKRDWKDEYGRPYPNNAKVKTNYYQIAINCPITYYLGISFNTAVRYDRTIFLAAEKYSLDFDDLHNTWSISTLAAHYNKLRPTLPLLYNGFKAKVFTDLFLGIGKKQDATYGAGLDLQYHQPLYKHITAVVRTQFGLSGGNKKMLYNLGGVDNNLTIRTDSTVHFAQEAPYSFQTLITPLRGYLQNAVYGSQYTLINADIYFPLFQSLIPIETPLSFINNLQLGLFSDFAYAEESWRAGAVGVTKFSYGFSARTTLAGYPIRFDLAYPESFRNAPVWYLSLSVH